MPDQQVCHRKTVSKTKLSAALCAAWSRVGLMMGRGAFADAAEFDEVTISRALKGPSLPNAENLLNSLAADPTALDEVFALYGLTLTPLHTQGASDLKTISDLTGLAGKIAIALSDGQRDHRETCEIADAIRPLQQSLNAICAEADRFRSAN